MEQFFVILTPIAQMFADNFWYFMIMFALVVNKRTSLAGFAMVCGTATWGFQTWIIVVCFIIALLTDSRDSIIIKANSKNNA